MPEPSAKWGTASVRAAGTLSNLPPCATPTPAGSAGPRSRRRWRSWRSLSSGGATPAPSGLTIAALLLGAAVLAAVHHAEVVAHRVGEPFGSLVLAVAVTVIEVALILTLMLSGGEETSTLARDTVFAAVMITCNGIVGISLLVGAIKFGTPTSTQRAPVPHSPA